MRSELEFCCPGHSGSESSILRKEGKPTRNDPKIITSRLRYGTEMASGHGRALQNFVLTLLVCLGMPVDYLLEHRKPLLCIIKTKNRLLEVEAEHKTYCLGFLHLLPLPLSKLVGRTVVPDKC